MPNQEDPEPPPHIKDEQEELWISQEGEQLQGLEEADITKSTFTSVPVKSEDDEEKPQSSQLHQRQTEHLETEADGEDCGGPEPARNSDPERHLQPETDDSVDSDFWKETREHPSGLNMLKNNEITDSDSGNKALSFPGAESDDSVDSDFWKDNRKPQSASPCLNENQVAESKTFRKPYSCPDCGKRFPHNASLKSHMKLHTGRENLRLFCLWCTMSLQIPPEDTHENSHQRETIPMPSVWENICTQGKYAVPHDRPHCGATVQLQQVSPRLCLAFRAEVPPVCRGSHHRTTRTKGETL
ncbi:hypothetical protein OYC64_001114 [Pagothenia borchgrevinki]|uniref:C2H2-type domain-containing protein n=1 Tax=Pagothenia borchgrevinki TaxID=8213 RepID=A0ABD2HG33_PAGBO